MLTPADACRRTGHELLLEVIPANRRHRSTRTRWRAPWSASTTLGVYPDWWKLPHPGSDAAWARSRR